MDSSPSGHAASLHRVDSSYAVMRLFITLILMIVGASGMYVMAVVLPAVQADFGVDRGLASLPYTLTMLGVGAGGMLMGRMADKAGIMKPLMLGGACLGGGFIAAALAPNIWAFMAAHCILIGLLGTSATFSPLVADTSLWFLKRRGIAVAVCASGNYLGGAIWPPIVQHFVEAVGWRQTYIGLGIVCAAVMCTLALLMRARPPVQAAGTGAARAGAGNRPFGLSTGSAQLLLCVAGIACCVAMAMPQVHIVAYCGDLGYGPARGAQMLSLMLACGVVSRLVSGAICDRIGGLRTLLLGSFLQGVSLLLFLPFDSLASLYVISALFGLFQGGIVPSYAIIVREYFPAAEAGQRVGAVIMTTMFGMAIGGWMSGKIFDLTGSYHAAFANGIGWNLLNFAIAFLLLTRVRGARLKAA
ncbi:MAG: putative MFS-type transporter YhjX [Herbaspirillum frisingense]|uniref:Putative MFS-type transporter YhjX n=1 Tax=Herbaspirillum frisingense TaxID=92645 RepID=A0A7V8G089_9BURK|nr:MAG: putative MFS-type transporter YhjX [Herbaspirillum frisingense]